MNSKEVVKKIRSIFRRMRFAQIYSLNDVCPIDSLVRIDEEIYDCDKCILADTINTVRREGDVRDVMCPTVMKRECRVLR